jgi:hypothetical protein
MNPPEDLPGQIVNIGEQNARQPDHRRNHSRARRYPPSWLTGALSLSFQASPFASVGRAKAPFEGPPAASLAALPQVQARPQIGLGPCRSRLWCYLGKQAVKTALYLPVHSPGLAGWPGVYA